MPWTLQIHTLMTFINVMGYRKPPSLIEDHNLLQKSLKKFARFLASITKNPPRFTCKQTENQNALTKNWKPTSSYTALITQPNGKITSHSQNLRTIYEYINLLRCHHLKSCLEHSLWTSPQHFHVLMFPLLRNASVILLEFDKKLLLLISWLENK